MTKRALILGTNSGQADIIEYLIDSGWEVHSCGFKREGPGCDLADEFHLVDTVDIDKVVKLAKRINADLVYSVSSDSAIRTATKVSEILNLPKLLDFKTIELFHHKELLRDFLNKNGINTIRYLKVVKKYENNWDLVPCVVKPSDSQGQRGIKLITETHEIEEAVKNALEVSGSGTAIIEEYLDGTEISTNVVIQAGEVIINEFTERIVHGHEYFGLPKGHSIPVRSVRPDQVSEASDMVISLIRALNIKDAVLYIQMIVNDNGPGIIEVAPRLDGCHIWRLLKISRGYDLRELAINCLMNIPIDRKSLYSKTFENYTLRFHQMKSGLVFHENDFVIPDETVFNEFRFKDGEKVWISINGRLEVVGYYIARI